MPGKRVGGEREEPEPVTERQSHLSHIFKKEYNFCKRRQHKRTSRKDTELEQRLKMRKTKKLLEGGEICLGYRVTQTTGKMELKGRAPRKSTQEDLMGRH